MLHKFPFPLSVLETRWQHHDSLSKRLIKYVLQRMLKYYQADQVCYFLKKGRHFFLVSEVNETRDTKEPIAIKKPSPLTLGDGCHFDNEGAFFINSCSKQGKINIPLYTRHKLIGFTQIGGYRGRSKNSRTFLKKTRNSLTYFATILAKVSTISSREKLPLLDLWSIFQGVDDKTTFLHSLRVAKYVHLLYDDWLNSLGFDDFSSEDLTVAALLHDLGKCCVDQEILHKKSSLNIYEKRHLAQHTLLGVKMLDRGAPTSLRKLTETVILCHHQRCAAQLLAADDRSLSLKLRLVQMLDMYDALSSPRSYKGAWREKEVFAHLEQQVSEISDRVLLQLLARRLPEMRRINENYSE